MEKKARQERIAKRTDEDPAVTAARVKEAQERIADHIAHPKHNFDPAANDSDPSEDSKIPPDLFGTIGETKEEWIERMVGAGATPEEAENMYYGARIRVEQVKDD